MPRTIHQGELQPVILLLASAVTEVIRQIHCEGGEAEIQRDSSLPGLGILVKGSRRCSATKGPGERGLPAVDMSQHPDVKIQSFDVIVSRLCHSDPQPHDVLCTVRKCLYSELDERMQSTHKYYTAFIAV